MKKLIFSLILNFVFASLSFAQFSDTKPLPNFSKIDFEAYGELHLIQGDSTSIEIDMRRHHHLSDVVAEVRGNTLYVHYRDCRGFDWNLFGNRFPRMDVYITYQTLDELDLAGKVKVFSDAPIRTNDFELNTSGYVVGDLEIYAQDLEVETEGYINMTLFGEAQSLEADLAGVGKLHSLELFADYCEVTIDGAVSMDIYTRKELDAEVNGVGSIYYEGEPDRARIDRNGLVRVRSCRF